MKKDWKETGVEYLKQIPLSWDIRRIKDVTFLKARIGWQNLRSDEFEDNTNWYCITGQDFKDGKIDWTNCYCVSEERYEQDKYIQLRSKDLLLTKDGTIGKTALINNLPKKATLNSGVFVLRPINNLYSNEFMFWVLNSNVFSDFIEYFKTGSTVPHLYQNIFERFSFPLPPLATQHAIADYLDKKLAGIDRKISLLEQKRDRYTALRKSLINQVVRRGLNPDVELKNSGIEWLGEIPKHWKVKRVKDVSTFINGYAFDSDDFLEAGVPVIKIGNITETNIDYENTLKVTENNSLIGYEIKQNDILIAMSGATIGKNTIVQENKKAYINQRVGIIRSKSNNYLQYLLNIKAFLDYILLTNASSAQPNISSTNISNFFIPFPPLAEQHAIADYLDKQSDKIDRIVENINAQLGKLAQLKKSLINECVTGEREVIAHKI